MEQTIPHIVVMGRPNVGKSTLFNRLVGYRRALVHNQPGVTRDRLEMKSTWWVQAQPYDVRVVDTGGLGEGRFAEEIRRQVEIALSEASCILMVFDGQAGYTPADEEIIRELNQSGILKRIPVIGIINKVDADQHESMINEFYASNLPHLATVSSEHGRGIYDLMLQVVEVAHLKPSAEAIAAQKEKEAAAEALTEVVVEEKAEEPDSEQEGEESDQFVELEEETPEEASTRRVPRIAILGRPNVGKSTLVNALLGEERMITSPIAGTTVDSIDSVVELGGRPFVFIDTAGMRRKSKTEQGVEVLSVIQTKKALENADLAILMLDGETGATDQDEKIGGIIQEAGVSVIIVVNKWDTQKSNAGFTREDAAKILRDELGFLKYAPIIFMSALRKQGINQLADLIDEILHQRRLKVPTHEFTEWVRKESTIHNPQNAKFYLAHQSGRHPPTFVVHVNDPERVHFSLQRYLVNSLRNRWGFMGSPVRLLFVEGKNRRSLPKKRPGPRRTISPSKE